MQEVVRQTLSEAPFWTVFVAQFGASFVYVWAKAFQQINVQRFRYLLVWPFSVIMGALEFYVLATISVTLHPALIVAMGVGGASGSNVAM